MYNVALIHFHTKQIIKTDFLKNAKKKKKNKDFILFNSYADVYML